jgi:uncharacterized protein with NAD-binding domain and iron-sulfur cluster
MSLRESRVQGFGRTQKLPITNEIIHKANFCACCNALLDDNSTFQAKTGHYVIDITCNENGLNGIYLTNTKHIRCWAHLERKGLSESLDKEAREFGKKALKIIKTLMRAVYKAREGAQGDLMKENENLLLELKYLCIKHDESKHEKTRALAREFIYTHTTPKTLFRLIQSLGIELIC